MENLSFFFGSAAAGTWFFVLGAALGSFACVCARRIPAGISVISPRSRCESCKTPVRAVHNVPVFGWIFLRGKCAHCKERIPVEHPLAEIFCAALSVLLYREFGLSAETFFYLALCVSLVVVTLTDIRHLMIPDAVTFPGIAAGLALGAIKTDWKALPDALFSPGPGGFLPAAADIAILDSAGGALVGGGAFLLIAAAYRALRKREGMGMGDVKLVSMLGAFFGMWGVLVVIFLSSVLGTLVGLLVIILRKKDAGHAIAYGPFLSVAAVLYLLADGLFSFPSTNAGPAW